ncbi:MAG TPA: 2,3-bisphosphoglycerate-independent phosphoglycerate mutase, partial [Gemmatimonadales bacterium]|nr:2,3-bisphosphoglycerate-independent phosphoglycerate mutase [Gemmatimonadales bacterium]
MAKRHGPRTPVVLIVLDGWGFRPGREGNAVELGRTPTWHRLWANAPRTLLNASGLAVGLPEGQIGNSEVGHLNLGAGRVVPQDIVRISQSIESGEFFRLPPLVELCSAVKRRGGTLHLLGLIGSGGVHALDDHLVAAVRLGHLHDLPVAIHAWLDGRDTPPQSGLAFMQELVDQLAQYGGRAAVSTVVGRYYAMDRDKRWERTKIAYDAMVHGVGEVTPDPISSVRRAYEAGETDEFVKSRVIAGTPRIRPGDGVFCFNYRADR